jgi:putative serine protease PepD
MSPETQAGEDRSPSEERRRRGRRYATVAAVAAVVVAQVVSIVALIIAASNDNTTRVVQPAPQVGSSRAGVIDATAIYQRDAPGVAHVQSSGLTANTPLGPQRETATGSGFVLDRRGDILTNAHVVDGARKVTVRIGNGDSDIPAQVVGTDVSRDLAVLRVDPSATDLHPLALSSAPVQVGDPVAAIGNPFGFDRTITTGIVSALQRQISAPNGFAIDHAIQTDAAINPGNSGGPLINGAGQVIGVNSQIATGGNGDANVGIGFAIPIDTAKQELPTLENGGTVKHAFLGVATTTGRGGALVRSVDSGSPADRAGLRPGDVIVSVGGKRITDPDALVLAIDAREPGQTVPVVYVRGGARHTTQVRLGVQPKQVASAGAGEAPAP